MSCLRMLQILFLVGCVHAIQRFVEVPSRTEVNSGENGTLVCKVSHKRGTCSWQKDNKPVTFVRRKYMWANTNRTQRMAYDCSLLIRAASLMRDDGEWQCQVSATSYMDQDALSSKPVTFMVRFPPRAPEILYNESTVSTNISVNAESNMSVVCESRYGNPPAFIEWYLESEQLTASNETNSTEVDRPKLWAARSVLELTVSRDIHGKQLICRAHHPSYPSPYYMESHMILDVLVLPEVVVTTANLLMNLEEGSSILNLECRASGNPTPYTWWTKDGEIIYSNDEILTLNPVHRNDSGIYGCEAKNSVGISESEQIPINIKYSPRVTWVGPKNVIDANLFSEVNLECKAEGNPLPTYKWYHNAYLSSMNEPLDDAYPIASTPNILLPNISYSQSGRYICVASNHIGAEERNHTSQPITLKVHGQPVVSDTSAAHVWQDLEGHVRASVCANPPPRAATWLWGAISIAVPSVKGRYNSNVLVSPINNCFDYTLTISDIKASDARVYVLRVGNEHGLSVASVALVVDEMMLKKTSAYGTPYIVASLITALILGSVVNICVCYKKNQKESVELAIDETNNKRSVLNDNYEHSSRDQRWDAMELQLRAANAVDEEDIEMIHPRIVACSSQTCRGPVVLHASTAM